jgi:alpha-tubulin suppressor-like RCC1 family protein
MPFFNSTTINCAKVFCGYAHTVLLDDQGGLYTFGDGSNGRLGLGSSDSQHAPSGQRFVFLSQVFLLVPSSLSLSLSLVFLQLLAAMLIRSS